MKKLTFHTLALSVVALGIGTAGVAVAEESPSSTSPAGGPPTAVVQPMKAEPPVTLEQQRGLLIEASGTFEGQPVAVSLYQNQQYGNFLQVVFPESDVIGALEQSAPFVDNGVVDFAVDVQGENAVLAGTVTETEVTKVVEPLQDNGEQLVSKGTRTMLDADLTLTYRGVTIPLEAAPAFSFDLDVRRVQLYGN
jgi:hypothetical protein